MRPGRFVEPERGLTVIMEMRRRCLSPRGGEERLES
jgi:hypothetical protein